MTRSSHWISARIPATWSRWSRPALPVIVVSGLLCLGIANITARATWHEVEDGVLWASGSQGVVVEEVAKGSPADRVGMSRGDLLLAIDDRPIQSADEVVDVLHDAGGDQKTLRYTVLRLGTREVLDLRLAPVPNGPGALYFVLAAVGVFTLARWWRGQAASPSRSGDPALLLVVGRVLRCLHLLVQRTAGSARLGLLLGRRDLDAGAAADVPALHAGVPRAASSLGARTCRPRSVRAHLRSRARSWPRANLRDRADPGRSPGVRAIRIAAGSPRVPVFRRSA